MFVYQLLTCVSSSSHPHHSSLHSLQRGVHLHVRHQHRSAELGREPGPGQLLHPAPLRQPHRVVWHGRDALLLHLAALRHAVPRGRQVCGRTLQQQPGSPGTAADRWVVASIHAPPLESNISARQKSWLHSTAHFFRYMPKLYGMHAPEPLNDVISMSY